MGDFYSPLEEKPVLDFGELSWTEASRDTWDATEDEEPMTTVASASTHPETQESLSVTGLSFEPPGPGKRAVTVEDENRDANADFDTHDPASLKAPDASLNFVQSPSSVSPQGRFEQKETEDPDNMLELTIPELDIAFFESDFYRRLHIQSKSPQQGCL